MTNDIIKSLIKRTFELRCHKMQMLLTPAYHTVIFEGTGRVWLTNKGQMFFSMLVTDSTPEIEREWLPRLRILGQHPSIMPKDRDEYLQLRAYTLTGDEWISNWLIPCVSFREREGIEIYGEIANLVHYESHSKKVEQESTEFVILNPPRLPFTMWTQTKVEQDGKQVSFTSSNNRQLVELDGLKIHFEEPGEDHVLVCTVEVDKGMAILNGIASHVVESLRFMTSTLVLPIYISQTKGDHTTIQLEGHISEANWRSSLIPPIQPHQPQDYNHMWEIFKAYLHFLLNQSHGFAEYHPMGYEYSGVMEASRGSSEGFALAVSVAIEAILNVCDKPRKIWKDNCPPKLCMNVRKLLRHINKWGGDNNLIKRATGAISNFVKPSAEDVLRSLQSIGVVNKVEIKAWKELRNKSAHGGIYKESEGEKMQQLITIVSGLLHRIVLYEIGYRGQFTDYSSGEPQILTSEDLER